MDKIFFLIFTLFSLPSRNDVVNFLLEDETNLIPYSDEFDCKGFTETLMDNAIGFDAFPVAVGWNNGDGVVYHVFVGFETSDGVVWVEPQNDRFYVVSEESLCYEDGECVGDLLFVYTTP